VGWAFWRSWGRSESAEQRPLPDNVGLPAAPSSRAGGAHPDQRSEPPDRSATSPFSGASPDGASAHVCGDTARTVGTGPPIVLDPATAARDAAVVAAAVRGVLVGDVATVDAALSALQDEAVRQRAAGALAAQALAARLPALSGVTGEVVFDEPADELLHAYADLLSERAEPLRRRVAPALRDEISAVAHLAAAAAEQDAGQDRSNPATPVQPAAELTGVRAGLVLPALAPRHQLLAACILLAQTCRDGGGDVDTLAAELATLAGETPG
jgi:hypothetical protein